MKTKLIGIILLLLALGSCNDNVKLFTGDYTYKRSGNVDITIGKDTFTVDLRNVVGQMDVIDLKRNDSVLIVKNEMKGDVLTISALVRNDSLFLAPYSQEMVLTIDTLSLSFDVEISGNGVIYDKNTIVITEKYEGVARGLVAGTIKGNSVCTVAKRN